jgi:hypothetical protein
VKNLKKTKAKLPKNEEKIGSGVSLSDLNQKRMKKLGKLKKR